MAWTPFLIMTVLGSLIWNILLVSLGRLAGQSWTIAAQYIHNYGTVIKIILILLIMGWIGYKFWQHFKVKKSVDKK